MKTLATSSLVIAALLLILPAAPALAGEAPQAGVTITGSITNLDAVRSYVKNDTVLQIVSMPPDGQLGGGTTEDGRIFYNSNLPSLPVPQDGRFAFQAKELAPGRYLIVLQNFQPGLVSAKPPVYAILAQGKKYLIFEIPENHPAPFSLDVGELYVRQ